MISAQDKEHAMEDTMNTNTPKACEAGADAVARMISATVRCRTHLDTYTHDRATHALEAALGAYREAMEAHELVWEAYGEDMSEEVFEAFCDAEPPHVRHPPNSATCKPHQTSDLAASTARKGRKIAEKGGG